MTENMQSLTHFLNNSFTAYHAQENIKNELLAQGFSQLFETEDWALCEGGKYFVERSGCLLAFTIGNPDNFTFKISASHLDSPALKLKENPLMRTNGGVTLNVETYGGGLWYSFLDRPLKIAGRVVKSEGERVFTENVCAPFLVSVPSQAIHMNRNANEGFTVNAQTDLPPLLTLDSELTQTQLLETLTGESKILSYDLFVVSAENAYKFGVNNEFLASPRIDNLTSAYATLEALLSHATSDGVCVAAFFNHEEIGSRTSDGACGDFMENVFRRTAYALRFDENEYYKALASSFLLSVDNAHATHPNHPEKSDPTNKVKLGGGVVIKNHANGAYITDAVSSAVVKTVLEKAGVKHQSFFNRSDMRSGSTLGAASLSRFGLHGADIGLAQLAMHSACECFAISDNTELVNGLTAYFSSNLIKDKNGFAIK